MPGPLSATMISTSSACLRVAIRIVPPLSRAPSACAAFVSRFMNTWLIWPAWPLRRSVGLDLLLDADVAQQVAQQLERVVDAAVEHEVARRCSSPRE